MMARVKVARTIQHPEACGWPSRKSASQRKDMKQIVMITDGKPQGAHVEDGGLQERFWA